MILRCAPKLPDHANAGARGLTTKLVAVESDARRAVTLMQPPDSRHSLPVFGTVAASDV